MPFCNANMTIAPANTNTDPEDRNHSAPALPIADESSTEFETCNNIHELKSIMDNAKISIKFA